jgi:haloacetate dehalogenase
VARQLAGDYFLVLPDLRGYGDSAKPPGLPDHSNYSKREVAADLVALMSSLGAGSFHLCGHDRGGRVAHRLALDHPQRVDKLCVLDIAPTLDMYNATDMAFARGYYHWFHLIQPAPLPETMIGADPRLYLHAKLGGWGAKGLGHIEDYRASAGIDLEHDRESRACGEQLRCDTMVLWGAHGLAGKLFKPLELWQAQCSARVTGQALPCGHYLPEELPQETADALWSFFRN